MDAFTTASLTLFRLILGPKHVHTWGKWGTTERGNIMYESGPKGFYLKQNRVCASCGMEEFRMVKVRR